MDLRKVKSMFPQGTNNYDTFCQNVHSRALDLVPEDEILHGIHRFSYTDEDGNEAFANRRVRLVLHDHFDKTWYDEELNPYKKESLPHCNIDMNAECRYYDADKVNAYDILPTQQRRLTQRTTANVEYLTEDNAKFWLFEYAGAFIWRRGVLSSRNVWIVEAIEESPYLVPRNDVDNLDVADLVPYYNKSYYHKSLCDKVVRIRNNGTKCDTLVPRRVYDPETESFLDYDFSGYTKCPHCGKWYPSNYIEENGQCRFCNHPEVTIYSYHGWDGRYTPQSTPGEDTEIFIGAEVEQVNKLDRCDVSAKECVADYLDIYHLERDSSLGGGFEMISQPLSWETWKANYERNKELFKNLIDAGMVSDEDPNRSCGGHKHISKRAFKNQKAMDRARAIIFGLRWEMEKFGRRSNNSYCTFQDVEKYPTEGSMSRIHPDHYSAITCSSHMPTVEVRFFKGTLNVDTLYAEIEFCKNLVEVANDFSKEVVYFEDLIYGDFVPRYWEGRKAKISNYIPRKNAVDLRFYDHADKLSAFLSYKDCVSRLQALAETASNVNRRLEGFGLSDLGINMDAFAGVANISLDEVVDRLVQQPQFEEGGAN